MSTLEAIVLGFVQGLTEFLPISSSGHLRIVPALLGWEDPGAGFTAVIQLGTMAAVLLYFRADLWRIASAWLHELRVPIPRATQDARLGWFIVLGTIPICVFGVIFSNQIESGARSLYLIGSALILFSFVMLAAERYGTRRRRPRRDERSRRSLDRVCPGPGPDPRRLPLGGDDLRRVASAASIASPPPATRSCSRSRRSSSAASSSCARSAKTGEPPVGATVVATVVAFVAGYVSIAWLLRYLASHSLRIFVVYRVALGALVLALAASGAIH